MPAPVFVRDGVRCGAWRFEKLVDLAHLTRIRAAGWTVALVMGFTEVTMKRLIAATLAALVLGGAVLDAHKGHKKDKKKDKDAKHVSRVEERDNRSNVSIVWQTREVEVVRTHYRPRYKKLPKGLQKKYARTGQLPPGWQKKMEPFPVELERHCAPLPAGYHRGVIDAHAVIYNSSGAIIDVAVLF
jgi:hypothetical protein